jgi:predicted HNH restriction endonuclease
MVTPDSNPASETNSKESAEESTSSSSQIRSAGDESTQETDKNSLKQHPSSTEPWNKRDIEELREKAESDAVENIPQDATTSTQTKQEYTRSQAIVDYVKARSEGICEGCGEPAPFISKTGEPYLHAHHIHELSEGGTDSPDTVVALCPNCHYRVHHGEDGEKYNQELLEKVKEIERK